MNQRTLVFLAALLLAPLAALSATAARAKAVMAAMNLQRRKERTA